MIIQITQPAGLGDILFCLKIAVNIIKAGNTVYWPVIPQYSWIKDYIQIKNLHWEESDNTDAFFIDLQSAGRVYPNLPIMAAKYKMVEMDYSDWQNFVPIKRNPEKELELFNKMVTQKPYCLICEIFASPPGVLKRSVPPSDYHNVYISQIEEYTPFDWCKLLEEADEVRLVDTCFTYLVEILNMKTQKMSLYSRDLKDFYTNYIWKKSWTYIK